MSLQEWLLEGKAEICMFAEHWQKKNWESPGLYPLELAAGDWDEQYSLWMHTGGNHNGV